MTLQTKESNTDKRTSSNSQMTGMTLKTNILNTEPLSHYHNIEKLGHGAQATMLKALDAQDHPGTGAFHHSKSPFPSGEGGFRGMGLNNYR